MCVIYLNHFQIDGFAIDNQERSNPYSSGYGRKIPTRYRLLYKRHWRRVYVMQYGNAGSAYVKEGKNELFLSCETEYTLKNLRKKAK